jgi:serine/threonine protein kinase
MSVPERIGIYEVERELGRGAMGVVYLCRHPGLGRQVAVKVLSAHVAEEPDFLERFRREGEMAARLRHPNIVQVYDFSQDGSACHIVMEYLGSQTLKGGARPLAEAAALIDQLLAALEHAHERGVIHRDLKPSNILLTDRGEVALTDFGIAFSTANQKLTRTGTAIGTPEYMAPEQFDGKSDARTDLYAVGIIFYELLTGFTPFRADTLTEVMKKQVLTSPAPLSEVDFTIPQAVSDFVDKALSKEPEERFSSANAMREGLKLACLAPLPAAPSVVAQVPDAAVEQPVRRGKPGLALVVLLALGLSTWAAAQRYRSGPALPPPAATASATSVVIEDPVIAPSPSVSAPASASETPAPLALTETPEASPAVVDSTTPAPGGVGALRPPEGGMIRPGFGVGEVNFGSSAEQLESAWGPPQSRSDEGGKTRYTYSGEGGEPAFQVVLEAGVLVEIDALSPRFSVENHPELALGVSADKVREELGNPSSDSGTGLDYRDQGLYFGFGSRGCELVRIYVPQIGGAP